MEKPPFFYVVWAGRCPGVYASWEEAQHQVQGYPNARYKRFPSRTAADAAYRAGHAAYLQTAARKKKEENSSSSASDRWLPGSIAVDAACSGNPGDMEYRGVDIDTRAELFRVGPLPGGTNNIGEFLAIVHALAYLHQRGQSETAIYSDSRTAQKWVREKQCRTQLQLTQENAEIFKLIQRAERWLHTHAFANPILPWDTKRWGENPADFGRK